MPEEAEDPRALKWCGATTWGVKLRFEQFIKEDEQFLALGNGPDDTHGTGVNLVAEKFHDMRYMTYPFVGIDARRPIGVLVRVTKEQVGGSNTAIDNSGKDPTDMSIASVIHVDCLTAFGVVPMGVKDTLMARIGNCLCEGECFGERRLGRKNYLTCQIGAGKQSRIRKRLSKVRTCLTFVHIEGWAVSGAEDGANRDYQMGAPHR